MNDKPKVYLAGQSNQYENDWKEVFKKIDGLDCFDWEFDSDQTSPDTFFPQDLQGVRSSDFLVANPGVAPSEATWIEIGYFHALNTKTPGDFCDRIIIIWKEERQPKWSIGFVEKTGFVVSSVDEAVVKLKELSKC